MSGLYSRNKGKRVEYEIRDLFRSWGYETHRVPSSGSSQGFKSDLVIKLPTNDIGTLAIQVEVKARKEEFKILYQFVNPYIPVQFTINEATYLIYLNSDPFNEKVDGGYLVLDPTPKQTRKLLSVLKYYKDCDVLVLKDDHKQPLLIKRVYGELSKENTVSGGLT